MTVTRDVVLDLLPLYLAQEVSADSRALVEAYLATDPELARLARAGHGLPAPSAATPPADDHQGRESLARARRLLRYRQAWFGGAITCTLSPLSFGFADGEIVWAMWRDAPGMAAVLGGMAMICWIVVRRLEASLRVRGL